MSSQSSDDQKSPSRNKDDHREDDIQNRSLSSTLPNNNQPPTPITLTENQKKTIQTLQSIPPGAVQSIFGVMMAAEVIGARVFLHPIDRILTILQTQHSLPSAYKSLVTQVTYSASGEVIARSSVTPFRGAIDAIKQLPKDRTLWRGLMPDIYGRIFGKYLQLFVGDQVQRALSPMLSREENPSASIQKYLGLVLLSGGIGGLASLAITYPMAVISARMQANMIPIKETAMSFEGSLSPIIHRDNFSGVWPALKSLVRSEGFSGLFRGFWTAMPGVSLYRGVQFAMFDFIRKTGIEKQLNFFQMMLLSQSVVLTAGTVHYPFLVISRRLMTQAGFRFNNSNTGLMSSFSTEEPVFYKGGLDAFKQIWKQEGIRGFYRGYTFYLVRSYALGLFFALVGASSMAHGVHH
ncbi:hypothetical protein C9374_010376 [Naegleria lovaniensis]|uniref:ADP/ATP translocase n=1 Tax=Naegleria lovaniensis TaxID=51637 RepID=A0AA88GCD5_NAELO|nr:uncharacterized protein C9374_010376 [Naegleria lovaniensis]KAG2375002.1 hypothetical protein C9374_010376 [Naegleria lovaniensis]